MSAGTYVAQTENATPKGGARRSNSCHPLRSVSRLRRRRRNTAAPNSATFEPISTIVAGSGVGVGTPSPGSEMGTRLTTRDPPPTPGPPPFSGPKNGTPQFPPEPNVGEPFPTPWWLSPDGTVEN